MYNQNILGDILPVLKDAPDISQPMVFTTATNGVNIKNYRGVLAVLVVTDAGTACTVTMKQGTSTTVSTALSFTDYYYCADYSSSNAFVKATATSNTFDTGTSSKTAVYIVPVTEEMLDKTAGSEDTYVRMNCASTANATGALFYICWGSKYGGSLANAPSVA